MSKSNRGSAAVFSLVILLCVQAHAASPNIIVILTDDQGYGDLSCYGAENISTPNIDRLAAEGMMFESFYVHNRCSPTRAALMTGCLAQRVGVDNVVYRWEKIGIHEDEVLIPELLKKAGYATGMVGKWHLGEWEPFHPLNHGFDSFFGFRYHSDEGIGIIRDRELLEKVKNQTDGAHSPKLLAAGSEFIKANRDRPFFLYYASPLPHTRWIPNHKFAGTSDHGIYGDVIQEIDWQVGSLMGTLDELGLADNTLVIFTSDNGPQLNVDGHGSSGPLRGGKWTNFEGGIRVPCIMRWPGMIPAGSSNDEITAIFDILPTLCEIAGVDVPSDRVIDGRSVLPYMLGTSIEAAIHDSFTVPGSTIRHQDWKLFLKTQKPGGGGSKGMQDRKPVQAGSLFDLKNDVAEATDVSRQHPEQVEQLTEMMETFLKELKQNSRQVGKTADWHSGIEKPKKNKKRK